MEIRIMTKPGAGLSLLCRIDYVANHGPAKSGNKLSTLRKYGNTGNTEIRGQEIRGQATLSPDSNTVAHTFR